MSDRITGTIRRTLHFSGHVQGVGFRFTTESIASRFDVTGFVKNLPDGRVEAVAEGEAVELDRFQQGVEAAMTGHIRQVAISESPPTGAFKTFSIEV